MIVGFTETETKLLRALLAQFQIDLLRQLRERELTVEGERRYRADVELASECLTKLDGLQEQAA